LLSSQICRHSVNSLFAKFLNRLQTLQEDRLQLEKPTKGGGLVRKRPSAMSVQGYGTALDGSDERGGAGQKDCA
jgi:hypothetical protein